MHNKSEVLLAVHGHVVSHVFPGLVLNTQHAPAVYMAHSIVNAASNTWTQV